MSRHNSSPAFPSLTQLFGDTWPPSPRVRHSQVESSLRGVVSWCSVVVLWWWFYSLSYIKSPSSRQPSLFLFIPASTVFGAQWRFATSESYILYLQFITNMNLHFQLCRYSVFKLHKVVDSDKVWRCSVRGGRQVGSPENEGRLLTARCLSVRLR